MRRGVCTREHVPTAGETRRWPYPGFCEELDKSTSGTHWWRTPSKHQILREERAWSPLVSVQISHTLPSVDIARKPMRPHGTHSRSVRDLCGESFHGRHRASLGARVHPRGHRERCTQGGSTSRYSDTSAWGAFSTHCGRVLSHSAFAQFLFPLLLGVLLFYGSLKNEPDLHASPLSP